MLIKSTLLLLIFVEFINAQGFLQGLGQQFGFDLGGIGGQNGNNNQQQQGNFDGNGPPPPPNRFGAGRGNLPVENLGQNVGQFLNRMGFDPQFTQQLGKTIDGVASRFFAPSPDSPIPPHVQRRIMRFCSRHPDHPKCQEHPELTNIQANQIPQGPQVGGQRADSVDLNGMFPNWIPFKIPPIPRTGSLNDFLAGVPEQLKNFIPPAILGQLNEINRKAIERTCASIGQCKNQKPESLNQRATLAEQESVVHRLLNPGKPGEQVDNDIELRMARTHQVVPANDGVFQKDILLTEQQSNSMINEINNNNNAIPAPGGRRKKRSALYLEQSPTQRWPQGQPIPYFMDTALAEQEKSAIEAAIQEIQSKTCVKFQRSQTKPAANYLYYIKIANPTFCGLSYIGKVNPANPIYLSFLCGNPTGVAIHETLHAIGLNHEQLRGDRDEFITINWENVNHKNYDFFAVADAKLFTSYGTKYAFGSIMHYASTIASQYPNKPTMTAKVDTAKNNALMGQRYGMAASDVELVNKLYCMPGCEDKNVYCGAWASRNLCNTAENKPHGYMVSNCQKSCNWCKASG
uniref:Metalloendopeptidase n=1 Tax=Ditylenchus dipsaci TaxID=166011 RepID=A0A915CL73_9BILA